MDFDLRLRGYRMLKPLQWPTSRVVPIVAPTALVGPGSSKRLCAMIGEFGFRRVLIVTDAMLVKLGLVGPIRDELEKHGVSVAVHDGITPDPICRGFAAVRAQASDAILAVGGSSARLCPARVFLPQHCAKTPGEGRIEAVEAVERGLAPACRFIQRRRPWSSRRDLGCSLPAGDMEACRGPAG